jgi:hypothetical protein
VTDPANTLAGFLAALDRLVTQSERFAQSPDAPPDYSEYAKGHHDGMATGVALVVSELHALLATYRGQDD